MSMTVDDDYPGWTSEQNDRAIRTEPILAQRHQENGPRDLRKKIRSTG